MKYQRERQQAELKEAEVETLKNLVAQAKLSEQKLKSLMVDEVII